MVLAQGGRREGPAQVLPGQHRLRGPHPVHQIAPGGRRRQPVAGLGFTVGALPAAEAARGAAHGGDHRRQAAVAAGEQGLDHAPAVAFRPQLDALGFQVLGEPLQTLLRFGAHRLPLEGRVGLGHEGADAQGEPQAGHRLAQLQQQGGGGVDVVVGFRRQAHHAVELEAAEAALAGVHGGGGDLLLAELLVHQLAHALAAAFDRDRERTAAALRQQSRQLGRHGGGPHGADAEAHVVEAILRQPAQQLAELRMLADGGAQQAEPPRGAQAGLHRGDQAVIEGGGAEGQGEVAGQTEAAQLGAAAHHFHHVDRGPGGLGADHGGVAEGVAAPGLFGHFGRDARFDRLHRQQGAVRAVAGRVKRRHVDPFHLRQGPQPLGPGQTAAGEHGVHERGQQQLAIAEQHRIEEGGQRLGVGREHGSSTEHDRVVVAPIGGPHGDALRFEQVEQHRPIELPAERQPEQLQPAAPPAPAAMGRVAGIGEQPPHVDVVAPRQGGPHHLEPQARDAHRVGARERQHGA